MGRPVRERFPALLLPLQFVGPCRCSPRNHPVADDPEVLEGPRSASGSPLGLAVTA